MLSVSILWTVKTCISQDSEWQRMTYIKQGIPVTPQAMQKSKQSEHVQWRILYCDMSRQWRIDISFQCRRGTRSNCFRRRTASTHQLWIARPTAFWFRLLRTYRAFRLPSTVRRSCTEPVDEQASRFTDKTSMEICITANCYYYLYCYWPAFLGC